MKYVIPFLLTLVLFACGEESYIPKPPTHLRLELPEHTYSKYSDSCSYSFELSSLYEVQEAPVQNGELCHRRIQLGPLNGTVYFRHWEMQEPLAYYVNNANDEIDRHKTMAKKVKDERIIRQEDRVFGTMFEIQGNVATPFQFYITDSTSRFVYGEVMFNSRPNYDSLKPSLDHLRKDLDKFMNTFQWKP